MVRLRRSLVSFSTGWVFLSTMLALRVLSSRRKIAMLSIS
jgi:hypothetical protein